MILEVEIEEDENIIKKPLPDDGQSSTNQSTHKYQKKLYDQAIPIDVKRFKEEKDILRLSENSSVQIPKEKEEL